MLREVVAEAEPLREPLATLLDHFAARAARRAEIEAAHRIEPFTPTCDALVLALADVILGGAS